MMEPSDKAKVRAERLARYSFSVAIRPDNSSAKPIISAMKQARTNDSKLRKEISKSSQKAVHIAEANRMNGPGIYVDQYLRNFLAEYNNRIFHGEGINQPSSFNILGAFVEPDEECLVLNLLSENHFSVNFNFVLDYLTLPETNHKYDDLIKDLNEFEIYECHILGGYSSLEIADSMELKFFGFACVREADELSIMALLGKKVENLEKEQIQDKPQIFPGKESFLSDAPYDVSDIEIVAGEGIVPIIALSRISLSNQKSQGHLEQWRIRAEVAIWFPHWPRSPIIYGTRRPVLVCFRPSVGSLASCGDGCRPFQHHQTAHVIG